MYTLKDITVSYKINADSNYVVLNKISLQFPNKGIVFVIGKSGCGKTTLLNILEGNQKPTDGEIFYQNKKMTAFSQKEMVNYRKHEIGILFQSYNLIDNLTVYENLLVACSIKNVTPKYIDDLLIKFNLINLKNRSIDVLSGGEKQRIAFLRAIINEPRVLLCDEPTGAIDEENSLLIMEFLKDYSKEHLVVVVTHNLELIENNPTLFIKDGKITGKINTKNEEIIKRNIKSTFSNKHIKVLQRRLFNVNKLKNILFFISLTFSLLFTFISISLYFGIKNQSGNLEFKFLNANIFEISNVISSNNSDSILQIVKKERPTFENIKKNFDYYFNDYLITYSFNYFLNGENEVYINENKISDYKLRFYYVSFIDDPVVVNDIFYERYFNNNEDYRNLTINLNQTYTFAKYLNNEYKEVNEDFIFEENFPVKNIYREFNYLNSPTIFINIEFFENYLKNQSCEKINREFITNLNWLNLVKNAKNNEDLGGYCLNLILFSKNEIVQMHKIIDKLVNENSQLEINSFSYTIAKSFLEITNLLVIGLIAFTIISIFSTLSLLFFIITSFCVSERKIIAILKVLGIKKEEIYKIFAYNISKIMCLSLISSLSIFYLIAINLNKYIDKKIYLSNIFFLNINSINELSILIYLIILIFLLFISFLIIRISIKEFFKKEIGNELKEE